MALSRSAVDKLGERLRSGAVTDEDWVLLEQVRSEAGDRLATVSAAIQELGIEVTGRVKTTGTLIDKLQREPMRLSQMEDIAGARMKVTGTRLDQDALVDRLLDSWPDATVRDRRANPSHGYRAVHVIVKVDRWPVEIQVRTHRQDAIANFLEDLADAWGRQIRYGGQPDAPTTSPFPEGGESRVEIVDLVLTFADVIDQLEQWTGAMTEEYEAASTFADELIGRLALVLERLTAE